MKRCPRRLFIEEGASDVSEVLWYYRNYKSGMLPEGGGLLDQPGMMMDLFQVIDGAVATVETADAAKRKQDAARASNKSGSGAGRLRPKG